MAVTESKKRGFTLVEAIMALMVFSVILYVVYDIFISGIRAFRKEEGKTQSMQSALFAYERIVMDIRHLMYYGYDYRDIHEHHPVTIFDDGRALSFVRSRGLVEDNSSTLPRTTMEHVTYRLEQSTTEDVFYLRRNDAIYQSILLTDMHFELKHTVRSDDKQIHLLAMHITGYGQQDPDHNLVIGLIGLDSFTERHLNPFWVQNPQLITGGQASSPW